MLSFVFQWVCKFANFSLGRWDFPALISCDIKDIFFIYKTQEKFVNLQTTYCNMNLLLQVTLGWKAWIIDNNSSK